MHTTEHLPEPEYEDVETPMAPILPSDCMGALVDWAAGSVWSTYPYGQHEWRDLGWEPIGFEVSDSRSTVLRMRSSKCSATLSLPAELRDKCCQFCRHVPNSQEFRKLLERAYDAPSHTPWEYLTHVQLVAILQRISVQQRHEQLNVRFLIQIACISFICFTSGAMRSVSLKHFSAERTTIVVLLCF
jgi:hypothetical protein